MQAALKAVQGNLFSKGGAAEMPGAKPMTLASRLKRFDVEVAQAAIPNAQERPEALLVMRYDSFLEACPCRPGRDRRSTRRNRCQQANGKGQRQKAQQKQRHLAHGYHLSMCAIRAINLRLTAHASLNGVAGNGEQFEPSNCFSTASVIGEKYGSDAAACGRARGLACLRLRLRLADRCLSERPTQTL